MKAWLASDLSELDLLVIQIDGLHVGDHVLVAAIGVDGNGDKHVLAVVEGGDGEHCRRPGVPPIYLIRGASRTPTGPPALVMAPSSL